MSSSNNGVSSPFFVSVDKQYDRYADKMRAWTFVTSLNKEK